MNAGNRAEAGGTVALPGGTNTGCGIPATLGGTVAAGIRSPTLPPIPTCGGGSNGEPVIEIGVAGEVALPLANTGWAIPAMDGGTGAGWIGGVPLLIPNTLV